MWCFRFRNSGTHNSVVPLISYAATAEKLGMETLHAQIRPNMLIVKGTTPPTQKKYPIFLKEKDIQELRFKDGLFFPEARKRYEERCAKVIQPLLSSVVKNGIDTAKQTK
jgi:hypothetical protein